MNRLSARPLVFALAALAPLAAQAQYRIDWYTIDGGGGSSSGGAYALTGTIGQPDAELVSLCSADGGAGCVNAAFELTGGFWVGLATGTPPSSCGADLGCIFSDGFEAGD